MAANDSSAVSTPLSARSGLSLRRKAKTTVSKLKLRKDLFEDQQAKATVGETPQKNEIAQTKPTNARTTRSSTKAIGLSQPSISTTPRNIGLPRLTESTNCRPYRLTLNRNIRKQLTKKRLEFHLANEAERVQEDIEDDTIGVVERPPQVTTKLDLIKRLLATQKELNSIAIHEAKVEDVSGAITRWRNGFASALDDLQAKLEPKMDKADLLEKLGIRQNMLKYAND